jgi:cytochrome b involved in lipid metabolism
MGAGATQRIYTASDVERHASKGDCWITRGGRVYDVTEFLDDHPGGNDLILRHAGKDVSNVMTDPSGHDHSQAAYDILNQYAIGKIGATPALVNGGALISLFTVCGQCATMKIRLGDNRSLPSRRDLPGR